MMNRFKTMALSAVLSFSAAAGAGEMNPELDRLAEAGRYAASCAHQGVNGVIFADDAGQKTFLPYSTVQQFITATRNDPAYERANKAFREAKTKFWRSTTSRRMNGGTLSSCTL
ncbi:MAG: hypothetical protein H6867_01560 [Rhodospirillales bacterium]|nr:hypothetical protein [Rhodospirillales bacterium]MCB9997204.1 hypothetical protein [Rhodospirillales bacterium]